MASSLVPRPKEEGERERTGFSCSVYACACHEILYTIDIPHDTKIVLGMRQILLNWDWE